MEGNELENIVLTKFYFLRVLGGPPTAIVEFRLRLHFSLTYFSSLHHYSD